MILQCKKRRELVRDEKMFQDAVNRAETLDPNPADRWPQSTGTHVYKLVRKLL